MTRAVVPSVVAVVLFVAILGPTVVAAVIGRPLFVDCGGLDPGACARARSGSLVGDTMVLPVTWYSVDPKNADGCLEFTIGYWWPVLDPFALTGKGLC